MTIHPHTKLSSILKENGDALEVIVSLSPKFAKLRNPLLRKVMAGRTTLIAAAQIGGCRVEDFYQKLAPLGFAVDREEKVVDEAAGGMPSFFASLPKEQMVEMDVRPLLAGGNDPLNTIIHQLNEIKTGQVLQITNTFEPTPLILLLRKKGFQAYVDKVNKDLVVTYFYRTPEVETETPKTQTPTLMNWEQSLLRFGNHIQQLDVRQLPMPQPMLTILEALDQLPADTALYVFHKRIPVYLLPELAERGFEYRIKEVKEGEVHLLIFRS